MSEIISDKKINLNSFTRNLLVIDVQGYELHVLKGISKQDLMQFQYLMCEVSKIEIYKGAKTVSEVKNYFLDKGSQIVFEGERRAYNDVVFKNYKYM